MSRGNVIRLLLGVVIFFVFLKWINVLDAFKYLSRLNLTYFLLGCLMMALGQVLRAVRFQYLSSALNVPLEFKKNLLVHFIASIFGVITPGKIGEGGKVYFFQNNRKELGFCFILEKLADLTMLVIFAALGSLIFRDYVRDTVVFFVILVVIFFCLFKIDKVLNLVLRRNIFENRWFQTNLKRISFRGFFSLFVTTLITWLLAVLAFYFYAASVDIYVPFLFIIQVTGLATTAGLISGSPGGIGVKEFVVTHLLSNYLGIDNSLAGMFALLNAFGNYLTFSIIALCSYYLYIKQFGSPKGKAYQKT